MEGDAGERSQLNPTDADDSADEAVTEAAAEPADDSADEAIAEAAAEPAETPVASLQGTPSRLGRAWLAVLCVALLVLSAGVATGGYLALRAHRDSVAQARADAAALQAAKDCVAATQAPDTAAMTASQQKIIDCSTGDFAAWATVFSGIIVEAYQAANAHVKVSELRAAVERHNDDGSILVLVALNEQLTNSAAADQQVGYRLRVKMAPADGTYKIAHLDQVAS